MGAIADLWKSERGLIAAMLIVSANVLAGMGKITFGEWREYTLYIFGTYAVLKTVTGAVATIKGSPVNKDVDDALVTVANTETEAKP